MIEKLYAVFVCIAIAIGMYLVRQGFFGRKQYMRFQMKPEKMLQQMMLVLKDDQCDEIFLGAGIKLSMAKYTAIRNLFAICAGVVILIQMTLHGMQSVIRPLCIVMLFYYISYPAEYYGKKQSRTPFKWVLDKLRQSRLEAKDAELMKIVTQMKNLILTQSEKSWAADYIVEVLMRYTKLTKPIFAQTLSYMRLGDMDQAYRYFSSNFGTKLGSSFADILLKLNALEPIEFLKQIEAFQGALKEEKRTRGQKKQEAAGRKMFLLASVLISLIFFDYMYIVFAYLTNAMIIF